MSIGTQETAVALTNHFKPGPYPYSPYDQNGFKRSPNGFKRIGAGAFRVAYLEKSTETVYKIGMPKVNVRESVNARRLRRKSTRSLGFDLVIPQTTTFRTPNIVDYVGRPVVNRVVAQEFAKGAKHTYCRMMDFEWHDHVTCTCKNTPCFNEVHRVIGEFTGLLDIHSGNVLMDKKGTFWLIDIAD